MNKTIFLLLLSFVLFFFHTFALTSVKSNWNRIMDDPDWAPIKNVKDPQIIKLTEFAISENFKHTKHILKLVSVIKGVFLAKPSGEEKFITYQIVFTANDGGNSGNKNYKAVVNEDNSGLALVGFIPCFGQRYPKHVHHRGASIPKSVKKESCTGGWKWRDTKNNNPNTIVGEMVAGPDKHDGFHDLRANYNYTEPTLAGNAGLVAALVALSGERTFRAIDKNTMFSAVPSFTPATPPPPALGNLRKKTKNLECNKLSSFA